MIVPATPRNDAASAEVTAASALAAICAAPSPSRGVGVASSVVWAVVADVMKAWVSGFGWLRRLARRLASGRRDAAALGVAAP